MKQYKSVFYSNKIKGKDLISLTKNELLNDLKIAEKDTKVFLLFIQLLK